MAIIYRLVKGTALTHAELDNNFKELVDQIAKVSTPDTPSGVSFSTAPGDPTVTNTGITETSSVVNNNGTAVNIPSLLMPYALAAAGKKRRDAIVVDYAAATPTYVRIAGAEVASTDVVPTPSIPANRLFVRYLDISDGAATAYQSELSAVKASLEGKVDKDANGNIRAGQSTFGAVYLGYIGNPGLFGDYNAYVGFNVERFKDTDNVSKWRTRTDSVRNGAYLMVSDSGGVMKIANIPTTGGTQRILTDAEMLALLKTPGEDKADKDLSINTQTASYTLQASDRGKLVLMDVASAHTVTIPLGLPPGFQCIVQTIGAGQTTFTAGSGMTLKNRGATYKSAGVDAVSTVFTRSSTIATVAGDLVA